MDQVIKQLWIEALRSGEYEQTVGTLHNDEGFCCLGVLCDLAYKEGAVTRTRIDDKCYGYGTRLEVGVLPPEVVSWAGMEDDNPVVTEDGDGNLFSLSELNDAEGWTFGEIADIIEEQL